MIKRVALKASSCWQCGCATCAGHEGRCEGCAKCKGNMVTTEALPCWNTVLYYGARPAFVFTLPDKAEKEIIGEILRGRVKNEFNS